MSTAQVTFTEAELLMDHPIVEPLMAGGVRCHGGFDEDGGYVSPRTLNRLPAIRAWQEQRERLTGTPLMEIPLEQWPEHYPNVDQARYLLEEGVRGPIVAALTRIGTVEGFGAMIRHAPIPDLRRCLDEEIDGTALAHLGSGLYEAHARDEAGHDEVAGHKQMWFAARDVAFENPVSADETDKMLARMGFGGPSVDPVEARRRALAVRVLPDDIDFELESLIARMMRILLIEISAFHTFAWAEELLSDDRLVAGEGEAARLVSYIRQDEAPHVGYLRTALSEIRDRTVITTSGSKRPGAGLVAELYSVLLAQSLGDNRKATMAATLAELDHALEGNPRRGDIMERFHSLGSVRPTADGDWERTAPAAY